ncbi:hypothetical protein ERJ75_000782800 [Trypanosoma vivax]|nr:hypothetical protein ERJ75_000782800 [Trypanosoma vivax]
MRRRFVACPKGENDHDDCEAEVPLRHMSRYLGAVFGGFGKVFDLKLSFFEARLPQGNCKGSRCRTETARLVELTRLPVGYKRSPEVLRAVARALAGG